MEDHPLLVFAQERDAPALRTLLDALRRAGYPAGIGVGIAGEATEEELDAPEWETAFLRWSEPEFHEVALLERFLPDVDEEANEALEDAQNAVGSHDESAGKLIAADHLRRTQAVYAWQILDALLADANHPAWAALDVALRTLAENADGIIYAEAEGFYEADGELLLAEDEDASETEEDEEDTEDGA